MISSIEFVVEESSDNFEKLNRDRLSELWTAMEESTSKGLFRAKIPKAVSLRDTHISDEDLALADYLRMKGYKVFWSDGEVIVNWSV